MKNEVSCQIDAYCTINLSEDPKKVKQAVLNILNDPEIKLNGDIVKASSKNIESLNKIYETIHSRKIQKVYRHQLNHNLMNNSTWFYLNKQAAFSKTVVLCSQADESPMGPIKVILRSKYIQRVIEWLISDSYGRK